MMHFVKCPLCQENTIEVMLSEGDPGCNRTANGDGWPPSGPEPKSVSSWCEMCGHTLTENETDVCVDEAIAEVR